MNRLLLAFFLAAFSNIAFAYFPSDAAISLMAYAHRDRLAPVCISIDKAGPSEAFLAMLKKRFPNSSNGRDCISSGKYVIHRITGKSSYYANLSGFRQISPSLAVAEFWTYGVEYTKSEATFIKRNGHWCLKSLELRIIS